jgi:hypothetical protein
VGLLGLGNRDLGLYMIYFPMGVSALPLDVEFSVRSTVIVRIEAWVGKVCSAAVVAGFLPEVGVEDVLFAGPVGTVLFAEFANITADYLRCNGMMEVGLGWLDVLVGKKRDKDIAGGGIDTAAFLVRE